jgi:YD repeat-containing protein
MKRILDTIGILFFAGLISFPCFSQSATDLPSIVPPPADAATLGRYGDVPCNLGIGLPNINVPIYEIKTPRLSVPISLNYYASGIKVDDQASWVGLGWSLSAGGVITRTIRGRDDLNSFVYPQYVANLPLADTLTLSDWDYENNVSLGRNDVEPDYFFYNFLNYSGKYIFGQNAQPLIINYNQPIQIQYDTLSQSFTLLDPKGNQFLFASTENAQSYSTSAGDYPNHSMTYISSWYLTRIISFDRSDTISFQYYTDAMLSQAFNSYSEGIGPSYVCTSDGNPQNQGITHDGIDIIQSESFLNSYPLRLKEIDFKNGKASFFSSGPRTDNGEVKLDSIVTYNYDQLSATYKELKTIYLSYDYFLSVFPAQGFLPAVSGSRLRLDSLQTIGNNGENGGKYSFLYDSTMLPVIGSNARDLFNFYNGAIANPTLVPTQTYNYAGTLFTVGAANRSTNADSIQAGILKHIYYPTGGRTDFTYEPNSFSEEQYNTTPQQITCEAVGIPSGGIQMGQFGQTDTVLFTPTNSAITSYVVYMSSYSETDVETRPFVSFIDLTANQTIYLNGVGDPVNGLSETLTFNPVIGHTYQLIAQAYDDIHVTSSIVVNNIITDTTLAITAGSGLRIKQTTDYDNTGRFARSNVYKYGTNESGYGYLPSAFYLFNTFSQPESFYLGCNNAQGVAGTCYSTIYSRVIFNSYSIYDVFNLSSSPLSYPEVAKYQMDSLGNVLGKSVYDYSMIQNGVFPVPGNPLDGSTYITNSWQDALLLGQTDYAYQSSQFIPVKRTINNYNSIPLAQGRGCKIGTFSSISGCYTPGPTGNVQMYAFDYPIYTGLTLQTSQTVYDYNQNDTTKYVESNKKMSYDNLIHLQPTTIQDTLSDGSVLLTVNRYPAEVDSISGLSSTEVAAIDSLQSRHNLTALIQSQTSRNASPVGLVRTDYKVWPNNMILEDSVELQNANFPVESRLQFYNYDASGNILQDAKTADVNHTYIWDYNNSYPIAQVTNAAQSDVAFTSFEANGSGNWTIGSGTLDNTTAITGKRSFNLNGSITCSGLNSSTTYLVSYWTTNNSHFSIAGTISGYPVQGKTETIDNGNWTLYVHKVTGQSAITLSGSGHIDELRLYPSTAQMTTYTYTPLVGMTSQTDVGNRVTYYEYDGLQRLKRIRDQDYNILKTFDYQYEAPGGCGSGCTIVSMQTTLGTSTPGYPVGVFDIHGNLVGNATGNTTYVSLWNSDTADARIGTLGIGADSMHFTLTLNTGQTAPAGVTGCRYFQYDLPWNMLDGVEFFEASYVDFGDGTGIHLGKTASDTPAVMPPNTTKIGFFSPYDQIWWFDHTYPNNNLKTITFYHNEVEQGPSLDNSTDPATSLTKVQNLRGNIPQASIQLGGSCFQQPSALTVANISNWNTISSIQIFEPHTGDRINPCENMSYAQDFMANNRGLNTINTTQAAYYQAGYEDTAFKLSRLKSNWNTYFTQLQTIAISDEHWNREDLSGLTQLNTFILVAGNQNHSNNSTNNPLIQIPTYVTDTVINQIAAGAGQFISNGVILIYTGGAGRTNASNSSVNALIAKGWTIYIDGVVQQTQ